MGAKKLNRVLASISAVGLLAGTAAACGTGDGDGDSDEAQFGYVLPRPIVTMNAGTGLGVATDAEKVSARLYPGAFIAGPDGQLLPNADLVTAKPQRGNTQVVEYKINPKAEYSDDRPVVCDDFRMAQEASKRPDLFGSDMPLFSQVASIDCASGSKDFTVHFKDGFGDRYRELFTPGTVLPTHSVAERAQVANAMAAFDTQDEASLTALGKSWQETFNVEKTDPATVPTHGPYRVQSRGEQGQLEHVVNTHYAGGAPSQSQVFVWPQSADLKAMAEKNQLAVADLGSVEDPEALGLTQPGFRVATHQSGRVDTLRLDMAGMFSNVEARRAFNGCVDRDAMVEAVNSKQKAESTPTGLRMLPALHPLAEQLKSTSKAQMAMNPERAEQQLKGQTIRVGYLDSVPRYQLMVEALKDSCGRSGVTIEPIALTPESYGRLGEDYDVLLDTRPSFGRNSMTNVNGYSSVGAVKKVEAELHRDMMTIPLLTEPRRIAVEGHVAHVSDNGGDAGVSWNMDRWIQQSTPVKPSPEDSDKEPSSPSNAI